VKPIDNTFCVSIESAFLIKRSLKCVVYW